MGLDDHVYKRFAYSGLCLAFLTLSGCPLLNGILESPTAAFEGAPVSGEAPLTVLFIDASTAGTTNITEWQWDFGDGMTSSSRNPTHIYAAPGSYNVSLTVTTDVGTNTALKRNFIQVVEPPMAEFGATPVAGSAPLSVSFVDGTAPGSSPITGWLWNFGDRTPTSAQQNPVHVYTAPGLYTVSLTVTTDVGEDTMSKTQFINVAGRPVAGFSANTTQGVAPLAVMFTDESEVGTATTNAWTWDFGDGSMAMEQNPAHTYMEPGIYTVTLAIETTAGDAMAERADYIVVDQGPTAAFTGDPVMGSAPLTVAFTDTSATGSQAITARLWNFGDGGLLSTLANPTRTYTSPGVYTVSLKVTTAAGSNTLEQADYITVAPGVSFTANQTRGTGNLTVQFVDTSATGDLDITAWAWDFGDGGMATERNPEHTYEAPGVYDVTLAITTALGPSTATQPGLITVEPQTAFSADPASGPPPLEVTFTDETDPGALEITAWAWDFGDGMTSDEQSPAHTYDTPGAYTVSLETTTALGASSEEQVGIIEVQPVADFTANQETGQGSLSVNFQDATDAGNLNILGWFWQFGDGGSSTQQNPAHTFTDIGSYDVSLTITTALGDQVAEKPAFIQVGPVVDFKADVVSGEGALTVTFADLTDAGKLEIEAWAWDFGDGATSDEQHPVHDYVPGQYSVSLTVTTSQGDTTTVKDDLILIAPKVILGFVQQSGATPFEASLLDLSETGMFEVTGWLWTLGDGNTSEEQNPVHTYESPGTYTVTLKLITDGGEFSKTEPNFITALRGPTAAFTHNVSRGGAPEDPVTVTFTNMSLAGDSPILNQTWAFGESAMSDEDLEMEENPVVVYPGTAFDTIPQDVSLTVRTFIAADTLLRENLYGAPAAKSTLAPNLLEAADLTQLAADASGDVWVAGALPKNSGGRSMIARLNPAAEQRWGVTFDVKGTLEIVALHAPGDGSVLAVGTWTSGDGGAIFLTQIDAAGETIWETVYAGSTLARATGVTALADRTIVVAGTSPRPEDGLGDLFLLTFAADGKLMARMETGLSTAAESTPLSGSGVRTIVLGIPTVGGGGELMIIESRDNPTPRSLVRLDGAPEAVCSHGGESITITSDMSGGRRVLRLRDGEITAVENVVLATDALAGLVANGDSCDMVWMSGNRRIYRFTVEALIH